MNPTKITLTYTFLIDGKDVEYNAIVHMPEWDMWIENRQHNISRYIPFFEIEVQDHLKNLL